MSSLEAARIPILAVLKPKARDNLLAAAKRRTWGPGEIVVRQGDNAVHLFIVESGTAQVQYADGAVVATLGPGEFFGELGLIADHVRMATVVADDTLTCILLPAWEFRALLDEHPEMAVPMVKTLIARMHGMAPHEH